MKAIMGHFTKTDWCWEFIKKYDPESHKPQAFISTTVFKIATTFCYLMNWKVEFLNQKIQHLVLEAKNVSGFSTHYHIL